MKVSEIAKLLDYEIVGSDKEVYGIAYSGEAKLTDIAVIKKKSEILLTESEVVLTKPILTPVKKTMLITYDDMGMAIAKICDILQEEGMVKKYEFPDEFEKLGNGALIGKNSIIHSSVKILPGVVIGNEVSIGENCLIEPNVVIGSGTILGNDVIIGAGSQIGAESFYHYYDYSEKLCQFTGIGKVVIYDKTRIGGNCIIQRGTLSDTVIGSSCMIGNCIDIGHDVKIGNNCKIVSQTGIAGNAVLKNNVLVYGQVGIANDVVVGNNVVIKAKSIVSKSIEDNQTIFGLFGREYSEEIRIEAKIHRAFSRKDD